MRLPRRIEWRAAVALLGAVGIGLALLIVLSLARMDVGVELRGFLTGGANGVEISVRVPLQQLHLLSDSRHIRIVDRHGQVWRGSVARISACWQHDRDHVIAKVEIVGDAPSWAAAADSSAQPIQAVLVAKRDVRVLTVLLSSLTRRSRS